MDHSKKCGGGSKTKAFHGTGYVLGSNSPAASNTAADSDSAEEPSDPLDITLRLWHSGFTVNDGTLREYSDPQNRDFLDTVRKGYEILY